MRLSSPLLAASLALGLTACAGNARPAYEAPSSADLPTTQVRNTNAFPVTVYLIQAGMRHRLGVVESMSNASFVVPSRVMTGRREFRLVASPLGPHPTYVSETFMLQPGQAADWRIQESTSVQASIVSQVSVQ